MALRARTRRLFGRLSSEGGFAVPTVMLMTVAALGMASVAVMTSVQGQSGTVRDQGTKAALAVAESGVSQALLHYNRGVPPCTATEGEWCGPVTGMSVNGGQVSYWARVASGEECEVSNEVECVEIVSQGTVNGVTRRVDVMASTLQTEDSTGGGPFATASVLSKEDMVLDSNAVIHIGTASNGNIQLKSNAKLCGPSTVGVGKEIAKSANAQYNADALCTSPASSYGQKELTLPPVNQGDAATNNDNERFFLEDVASSNSKKIDACWNGLTPAAKSSTLCKGRELYIDGNTSVTLGGSVYSFCKLKMRSNSNLFIAPNTTVTIYFDSPEACGYSSGVTQLEMDSKTRITSATGDPVSVAMLFVGSETLDTNVLLNSNTSVNGPCDQNFVIYAPLTDVRLNSNARFCGAIAAKTVHMDSNAEIWSATGSEEFNLPGVEIPETPDHFVPYRFVECGSVAATYPDDGC